MIKVDTSGISAFIKALQVERARVDLDLRTRYRNWIVLIHADISELTPQWGGNLAANWYLDIGAPTSGAQDLGDPSVRAPGGGASVGRAPYSRGSDPAVGQSLARGKAFVLPQLTDKVFIHNPVEYADAVELDVGPRPIRAINRVPRAATGKVAMVYHAHTKYSLTGSYFLQ